MYIPNVLFFFNDSSKIDRSTYVPETVSMLFPLLTYSSQQSCEASHIIILCLTGGFFKTEGQSSHVFLTEE